MYWDEILRSASVERWGCAPWQDLGMLPASFPEDAEEQYSNVGEELVEFHSTLLIILQRPKHVLKEYAWGLCFQTIFVFDSSQACLTSMASLGFYPFYL